MSTERLTDLPAPSSAAPVDDAVQPVFIGGTGRSGTTILGRLLGRHSTHALIPVEAKFHCDPRGLPAVVAGRSSPGEFADRLSAQWTAAAEGTGLRKVITRDDLDHRLAAFTTDAVIEPVAAARTLADGIFSSYARREGKESWIEMTPRNVMHVHFLKRAFPDVKLVHVFRDGRDVAASLLALGWKRDPLEALDWWEVRMRQGAKAIRSVSSQSVLSVQLEDLVARDRAGTFAEVLAFLGWTPEPKIEQFFARQVTSERAHFGRWEAEVPAGQRSAFVTRYAEISERLRDAGVTVPTAAEFTIDTLTPMGADEARSLGRRVGEGVVPLSRKDALRLVLARVRAGTPTALIRFGEGEGRLLVADATDPESMRTARRKLKGQTGYWLSHSEALAVCAAVWRAFDHADIIGVTPSPTMVPRHVAWQRRVADALRDRVAEGRPPPYVTYARINDDVLDALPVLLAGAPVASVISPRDVAGIIKDRYGVGDVATYPVPSEHIRREDIDGPYEAALHDQQIWPEFMADLRARLEVRVPGEIFLVGAGMFGKELCIRIKELGGVALDLGSCLDFAVGKASRGRHGRTPFAETPPWP